MGTKIKHIQDCRKSPTKKHKYPVEHMEVPTEEISNDKLIYFDHKTREKTWMTEKKIERFGAEMTEWANTPEATKLSKFFHSRNITRKVVLEWAAKWPSFAEDYQLAKEIIGDRLFDGGLTKIYDTGIVARSMPMYDEEWKEESDRVARLKIAQEQEEVKRPLIVQMVNYGKKIEEANDKQE